MKPRRPAQDKVLKVFHGPNPGRFTYDTDRPREFVKLIAFVKLKGGTARLVKFARRAD